jgi:hypothetical protein
MKSRTLALSVALILAASSAFAAAPAASTATTTMAKPAMTSMAKTKPAARYYVAHAPSSTACSVVSAKPDGKTMIMAGKFYYKTRAAAAAAAKKLADCK